MKFLTFTVLVVLIAVIYGNEEESAVDMFKGKKYIFSFNNYIYTNNGGNDLRFKVFRSKIEIRMF